MYFLDVSITDDSEGIFAASEKLPKTLSINGSAVSADENVHIHECADPVFHREDDYTCTASFSCTESDDVQSIPCLVVNEMVSETGEITYRAFVKFNGRLYAVCYPNTQNTFPETYSNAVSEILPSTYGTRRTSFLSPLPEGGWQSVIYEEGQLYIEEFDADWTSQRTMTVALECPRWGGFYSGEQYNYVVCGKAYDSDLDDGGEVYSRIFWLKDKSYLICCKEGRCEVYEYTRCPG